MATPVKWGHQQLVNSATPGFGFSSSVTGLVDGRYVVAWTDTSKTTSDTSGYAIQAQVYNADGSPSGSAFLVNTTKRFDQMEPAITALADGGFVLAWSDSSATGGDKSSRAVRAQVFTVDGSASGAEFLVNTTITGVQAIPIVTTLADGRFVMAWTDLSKGLEADIRAQMFNADGTRSGAEFLVSTKGTLDELNPTITALAGGRFVMAWTDYRKGGTDSDIHAQLFAPDGSMSGPEFLVNTTVTSYQIDPSITTLVDGRFVVAWTDESASSGDVSGSAIRAQVFTANGSTSGAEILVNTTNQGNQYGPVIAALADGRFVIAWTDISRTGGDTSGGAIRAQVFNADGTISGAEFLVNTRVTGDQTEPTIAALADGRFVVTWTDASSVLNADIRSQIFDPRESAITLHGSKLDDQFVGTVLDDRMSGEGGSDLLTGTGGDDTLEGNGGGDILDGGLGADTLAGGSGNDSLAGGRDDDMLSGGFGTDTFVLVKGGGDDVVTDFQDGRDGVDLAVFGFADFSVASQYFAEVGSDLLFSRGQVTFLIENFTLAQLDAADLIL